MKKGILFTANKVETDEKESFSISYRRKWITILYVCSIGGLFTGFFGLFISALAFFHFVENPKQINLIGTWLMVAAFPVTMLGAHAMDKIAKIDNDRKRASFEAEQKKFIRRSNGRTSIRMPYKLN